MDRRGKDRNEMASSQVQDRTGRGARPRTWYGRRREPQWRKPTPKGGYDRYRGYDAPEELEETPRQSVDLSITAFVLGAAALVLAWWPWLKFLGVFCALAAVVVATRELSRHDPESRILMRGAAAHAERFARTGRTLALIAVLVVAGSGLWGLKTTHDARAKAAGTATQLVLDDLNVRFGAFATGLNGIGQPVRWLPVSVTNRSAGRSTFTIQVEALDANGQRIASEEIVQPSVRPGETREQRVFQFVDEPTTEALKTARFRVATAVQK